MLTTHQRFPYSSINDRPDFLWPDRKRLAVYIGLNLEHFSFGEGLGAKLAPADNEPDVLNYAWRDYGNRVGVWRLFDLFQSLEFPASLIVNSEMYAYAPEIMKTGESMGWEIVAHGRTNSENQGQMDEKEEFNLIKETAEIIHANHGKNPAGWLGPWIAESKTTPDLLQEAGYTYLLDWCHDDQPVWLHTRSGGSILSVPYPQEINDIPAIVVRRAGASEFADMIVDHFDEMSRQSNHQSLVMGIALHPYIVGQPFRLKHLRKALTHIASQSTDRVWTTTAGAIANRFIETSPNFNHADLR